MNTDIFTTRKLKSLVDMQMGPTILQKDLSDGGLPVFSAGNQEHPWGYTQKNVKAFNKGILVVSARGTIGVPKLPQFDSFTCTQTTIAIQTKKELEVRYLYYFLQTVNWGDIVSGVATPMLTITKLGEIDISLPSIEIQREIVSKLDAIIPQIKLIKSQLGKASTIIRKCRQSIRSSACSGSLTSDWRLGQKGATFYEVNKSSKEIRDLGVEIPEEWDIMAFTDVCQISTILVDPADYQNHPHIAPDNIEKESGKLLPYNTIAEDRVISAKHLFHPGQIIYSKIRPYLSKAILAGFDGLCSADMYPLTSRINPRYLLLYLLSPQFVKLASSAGERSVLPKINKKELSIIPVPVPSVEEQQEIVTRVHLLINKVEAILAKHNDLMAHIKNVEKSILSRVFNGGYRNDSRYMPSQNDGHFSIET